VLVSATLLPPLSSLNMKTINPKLNQLERAIDQTLTSHREQLQRQAEQINSLTQLLNTRQTLSLDEHCTSAMHRLTELLDRHQQANQQVYHVLTSLTETKDTQNLTLDCHGEIATCLKLELGELAQRLGIDRPSKLSTAANNTGAWSKLMAAYPDPDGYQWQLPAGKRGFYHQTHLQAIGTKTISLTPDAAAEN
jgi:hypothetical protein